VYAIIEDSGTQLKVAKGDVVDVDLRDLGDAKTVTFDRVLLIGDEDADKDRTVGMPYVDGASVKAELIEEFKDKKIDVIKFKRRKGYRRKQGHRQRYLRVKITDISA
jgi:large subunit ribosomal protein L21